MDLNANEVFKIIGNNRRFTSPFEIFSAYYIVGDFGEYRELYFDKLKYAVNHADSLLGQAFCEDFFDFYGVDKTKVSSPEEMLDGLIFDSFVLVPEQETIGCCVSNQEFMFGHFIEIIWDYNWNLQSVWIN